ncbi:MAG: family 43 glycosylhydrolase [Acetatifactor sp.]
MKRLWSYTREPIDEVYYDPRLAYSMHLMLEEDGEVIVLNHNSGVLFAKATENEDGSLNPKSIRYPYIHSVGDGVYEVLAVRTMADGEPDVEREGKVLSFTTKDFVSYTEQGLREPTEEYLALSALWESGKSIEEAQGITELPEGAHLCNCIEIPEELAQYLKKKLLTPHHVKTVFPEKVLVGSGEELCGIKAKKVFSDGTISTANVDWNLEKVDFSVPGEKKIEGTVHQDLFPFPVVRNHADPCIGKWNGKYYFIATYDGDHEHTMYIREADSIPELVHAKENLILDSTTHEGIGGLLWAPELHVIGGRLCILHAATPDPFFEEESRIMILKDGGNPIVKEDWEAPRRIVRADGSDICEAGKVITLDMTHFVWDGEDYVIWAQRQFLPKDLGSWLYLAKLNPREPWKLAGEPVLLTKPEYGWENNHTFVVEGPFALIRDDKLYVTYSAAAVDTSYVVGLLTLSKGHNILDASSWKKSNFPLLTSRSVPGEYGTGHNAYVEDENGDIWNTYHARPGVDAPRCSGIRQVHFDVDGQPILDMTEDCILNPSLRYVETTIEVRPTYHNPVIYADVPDMDIIRSRDKEGRQAFYMVSTTMHLAPGVPIMKSFDLVHWATVNYVYQTLESSDRYCLKNGQNDYSIGSWAASLRQDPESGWFFVAFTCNSTQKTYIFMAEDIECGPWYRTTFPEMCYDNGLLFDETDGRKYIFFSDDCRDGLGTHDICYRELFIDLAMHTIDYGPKQFVLHNSNYENPKQGLWGEGFHVYQHNGYYYIFVIQGQAWQRQELCWRSKSLSGVGRWDDETPGDWTCKKVFVGHLFDENDNVYMNNNGIAQGGIVSTEDGKWYCFIFQDTGAVGRIPMLCPMEWGTEGEMLDWPIIGRYLGEDTPFLFNKMPVVNALPVVTDQIPGVFQEDDDFENDAANYRCFDRGDLPSEDGENDFNGSCLKLQWQWNHNPDNRFWSLTERPGFLRLQPAGTADSIRCARNMLTIRTMGPVCEGTTVMDISHMTEGMTAGMSVFQRQYGYVAVVMEGGKKYLVMQKADHKNDIFGRCCARKELTHIDTIYLRIHCDFRGRRDVAGFFYSIDNVHWLQIGELLYMNYDIPDFMGYRYGLFTYAKQETDGFADFDWFRFDND